MEILREYQNWLKEDAKTDKTIENYRTDVKGFLEWIGSKVDLEQLRRADFRNYFHHLRERAFAVSTINKKVNSLRSFNDYLLEEEIISKKLVYPEKDRIKIAKGSNSNIEIFSADEVERILSYLDREEISQRDRMIVHLLLYTGIRVGELVEIRLKHLDLLVGELKVVGKGSKYREIPLNQKVRKSIRSYLQEERNNSKYKESDYLILTQRSPKAHRDTINNLLNKIGDEVDLKVYPHKFRHTCFTILIRKGVDIATVSELAGHSSIETTHRYYLSTSKEEKAKAVELL
ncbi:tyrosine-type recombinase/integrase [Natroniella sulfidigena]|uniref:tyrosine-type recombinase/integrase n=1 Tax=Natroniella sulfidigena TaxID=723921 RepID=UPI002009F3B0|nr:tyrosine-type recombinase/integrase [Natroniella sulfidigena]MCK8816019.1 tyrosine-type recombinase/integrase [Natroniella sulfidigena]